MLPCICIRGLGVRGLLASFRRAAPVADERLAVWLAKGQQLRLVKVGFLQEPCGVTRRPRRHDEGVAFPGVEELADPVQHPIPFGQLVG